jgi:hypothetical protein
LSIAVPSINFVNQLISSEFVSLDTLDSLYLFNPTTECCNVNFLGLFHLFLDIHSFPLAFDFDFLLLEYLRDFCWFGNHFRFDLNVFLRFGYLDSFLSFFQFNLLLLLWWFSYKLLQWDLLRDANFFQLFLDGFFVRCKLLQEVWINFFLSWNVNSLLLFFALLFIFLGWCFKCFE